MVERANTDRIFLVYKKGQQPTQTRIEVRKFVAHLNQELHKIFPPESLQVIRTVSTNMSYYSPSTQDNTNFRDMVKKYADKLNSNPQEDETCEENFATPPNIKKHYITTTPSTPTSEVSSLKSYSQATAATPFSNLTDPTTLKQKQDLMSAVQKIENNTSTSDQAVHKCTQLQEDISTYISTQKTELDGIISRATSNIASLERNYSTSIVEIKAQTERAVQLG